jgi:hypothetical protein
VATQTRIAPDQIGPAVDRFVSKFIRYVLGPIVIGVVLLLLYAFLVVGPQQANRPGGTASPVSLLRPFSQKLMNETFEVPALSWRVWTLQVNQASVNPHLVGTFQAAGGMGNDIQVVVAEEPEFQNWINGHPAAVLYGTGRVTTGRLDVPIPKPGSYVIAFSNKFSLLSRKSVAANIDLQYLVR